MRNGVCVECDSFSVELVGDTVWCLDCGALISDMRRGVNCAPLDGSLSPMGRAATTALGLSKDELVRLQHPDWFTKNRWGTNNKGCSVAGCKNSHGTRGMCNMHYNQARTRGEF